MYAMCKFKCPNHRMPIVNGRYANIPVDERLCMLCQSNEIGDEYHYLFVCNLFSEHRVKFLKRHYFRQPNMDKMTQLFNTVNHKELLNLAKFIKMIIIYFQKLYFCNSMDVY